jgi:hypothetical protein
MLPNRNVAAWRRQTALLPLIIIIRFQKKTAHEYDFFSHGKTKLRNFYQSGA